MILAFFPRIVAGGLALLLMAGCERQSDLTEVPVSLGDMRLGLNIVVADNVQKVPISRDATVEEWEASVKEAVQNRFGRYEGNRFYNIGISVDGYALAPPGIPVVASPKSVLVITANIWDDGSQTKLNGEGKQFTIFESLSGESVIGTGITRSKKEQMTALSYNAVKAVEGWLVENPQWFLATGPVPDPTIAAEPGTEPAAPAALAAPAPPVLPAAPAIVAAGATPAISVTPLVAPAPAN